MNKIFLLDKAIWEKLKEKNLLLLLGLFGIFMILAADGCIKKEPANETIQQDVFDKVAYTKALENQLTDIISQIDGAGEVKVMVTLESSEQIVYAYAEKTDTDITQKGSESYCERSSYENNYIMVDDGSGGNIALRETILEPGIKGVAVICSGGDDVLVEKRIVETVSTLLDIPTNRICVTKMT